MVSVESSYVMNEPMKIPTWLRSPPGLSVQSSPGLSVMEGPMKVPLTALSVLPYPLAADGPRTHQPDFGSTVDIAKTSKAFDNDRDGCDSSRSTCDAEDASTVDDSSLSTGTPESPESMLSEDEFEESAPCNKGSSGHPNFCGRPCIYFASGICKNGVSCGFCHLGHDGRSASLDKRNRLRLRKLSLAERADLILPMLAEWAQLEHLTVSLDSIAKLQCLINEHPVVQDKASPPAVTNAEQKQLRHGLKGLQVQDLIGHLKSQEAPLSVQLAIETLAFELQQEWTQSKA